MEKIRSSRKPSVSIVEVAEEEVTEQQSTRSVNGNAETACRPGISSMSLGRAWHHELEPKLRQASQHGFRGIEIFEEDLIYHASSLFPDSSLSQHSKTLLAAKDIFRMCNELNMEVICLQPFRFYEGLVDRSEHTTRIAEMRRWLSYATALGTDLIAIASTFLPANECTGDVDIIASDLREIADLGAAHSPPIRFTYEALCWGTHVDTWEACWSIVRQVDRPNFGICLDTFNIAGRAFADPAQANGLVLHAEDAMAASLARMRTQLDVNKVFYVQLVDAELLNAALDEAHPFYKDDQPARMSWSRNCRLFYGEVQRGAYLPIRDIAKVVFEELGYRGWVSMELFNRSCAEPGPMVPVEHARRGIESWAGLVNDFPFLTGPGSVLEAHRRRREELRLPTIKNCNERRRHQTMRVHLERPRAKTVA